MYKECSVCLQTMCLTCFDKQSTGKQGCRADCKECRKRFTRSKRGLVKSLYTGNKARSKKKGYVSPTYSEDELYVWMVAHNNFIPMFDAWVESGYAPATRPSIDRLNDYEPYALTNIQLVTWASNSAKGYADQVSGKNNKKSEAVDMLDMEGNFIERFHSVSAAARNFNGVASNITGAITNRVTTRSNPDGSTRTYVKHKAYGHKWRYSNKPN